jgi:hypothetical protein
MRRVLCFVSLILTCAIGAHAQCTSQNTPPSNASANPNGVPTGWKPGTPVTVYVNTTGYNSSQVSALEAGFTNWQNSTAGNQVTYSFIPVTGQPVPTGHWVYVAQGSLPRRTGEEKCLKS